MKYLHLLLFIVISCTSTNEPLDADRIISNAVNSFGLNTIESRKIDFDFRDKHYSVLRQNGMYTYTRSFQDSLGFVNDVLVNSADFTRFIDGNQFALDSTWNARYSNSVNSVLYFVQLPLTLTDPAALKKYKGITSIKDKTYHLIEVRFQEEGGGKDFEDVFLYWFDMETYAMDYLAYSYITDGGGVRFREAMNRRVIEGITFQDYVNYKPEQKTTPLDSLSTLYQSEKLIEVSRIENVNITVD